MSVCVTMSMAAANKDLRSFRAFDSCIAAMKCYTSGCSFSVWTVQAVYSILDRKKVAENWEEAQSVLADAQILLQRFLTFVYMQNPSGIVQRLREYVENPCFKPNPYVMRDANVLVPLGCEKMCAWLHALYACAKIAPQD
eukprot:gnl/MRDRNA2_/MRDRNA2_121637_c0_seq1.p1 gnl/MRDRNA2_/MRDRNA2_121637_c0~~gnl/MRDRNA2_/MRDRNA2_121637_c0_seq1.p1  ORF type:complete len:140 (+),score=18.01 gnl/MRDRNA2_/MRDRNA2_121637_c0_seq1:387-806(+)